MRKKTIFLAQYRLPFPAYISGADIANMTFLHELKQCGFNVVTLYCTQQSVSLSDLQSVLSIRGIQSRLSETVLSYQWKALHISITTEEAFLSAYFKIIEEEDVDWVWHHNPLFHCPCLTEMCETSNQVKHMAYLQSEQALSLLEPIKSKLSLIISNSRFMKNVIWERWSIDSPTIYPIPDSKEYQDDTKHIFNTDKKYITFINPNKAKGAEIVYELIQRFPKKSFLIVLAWLGVDPFTYGILPKEWDFSQFENVKIQEPVMDMRPIYAQTRLLLVPSLCLETFGRVQVEAAMSGVPSIISDHGALPEIFVNNGLCVSDYNNVDAWERAVRELDQDDKLSESRECCHKLAQKYDLAKEVEKLINLMS